MKKEVAIGVLSVGSARLVGALSLFTINLIVARNLGGSDLGGFLLALTVVSTVAVAGRLGLDLLALRIVADATQGGLNLAKARSATAAILRLGAMLALLAFLILIAGSKFLYVNIFESTRLFDLRFAIGIWMSSMVLQTIIAEVFRALSQFTWAAYLKGPGANLLGLILTGLYAGWGSATSLELIVYLMMISSLFWTALGLLLFASRIGHGKHSQSANTKKQVKGEIEWNFSYLLMAAPLGLTQLSQLLSQRSDMWLLGGFFGEYETGIYGASARLVVLVSLSLNIINGVVPPIISRLKARLDIKGIQEFLQATAFLVGVPTMAVLILLIMFSGQVLQFLYGAEFARSAGVLQILAVGQAVNVWVGSCGYCLIMFGQQKILLRISMIVASLAFFTGWVVLSLGGSIVSLALVQAIFLAAQQLGYWIFVRRNCGVWTHIPLRPRFGKVFAT